jgi:pre-60S factor REI1
MIDKQHCKLRYEEGFWEELDPFYDFSSEDKDFVAKIKSYDIDEEDKDDAGVSGDMDVDDNGDEDGWEDMSYDGEGEDEDEEMYKGYEREIKRFGLNVNALGELVFPDGRIVGHRALRRYYKQRENASTTKSLAIVAAKKASGERLYNGQVVNIYDHNLKDDKVRGAGRGILVAVGGSDNNPATFSALSLYRYRAAVRKQRRGDFKGKKIREKAFQNINRMDKKANRLMNGVSVAHAAR